MRVFEQQSLNKLFIMLSISLLITLSPRFTFAQNPSAQIEIDFSQIQGVSAGKETFTLELKDSRVDVSHITERIRSLMNQSDYQNISFLNYLAFTSINITDKVRSLCSNLVQREIECEKDTQNQFIQINTLIEYQRFLYPDNYHPIGSLPPEIAQKANSTSCCYDQDVAKTLLYGSSSQYNQTINKLKDSGASCLKQAGHAVIENLQSHTVMEKPDNFSFCRYITNRDDKSRCQQLQNDYTIIQERITSLTNLIKENETPLPHRSSACLENIANNNSLTSQIGLFKQDLDDHQACGDYSIGEERIKSSTGYGGGGYTIKRDSNDSYTANLFIEFVPSAFYDNEDQAPRDQVQNHYAQTVQSCIDKANPYLKGPNGQRLNIVIRTPDANSCVPKNTITIWNAWEYGGAQAQNYPSNINDDCLALTHEVLHNLGLADEYLGSNTYYPSSPEYDDEPLRCSMNEENTIMNNVGDRWANVFDSATEDSLLDPTHFNVILYRGCSKRDDVRLYKECKLLKQNTETYSCREKKFYCDNQNTLGRDKSRELQRINRMLQGVRNLKQQGESYLPTKSIGGIYSNFLFNYDDGGIDSIIQTLENRRRVVESWPDN